MLNTFKDKRPLKPSVKSSQKLQPAKANEQLTVRINKSAGKNSSRTEKMARSPEMIRLMIEELERQLMTKTKSKNNADEVDVELSKTKRKLKINKNAEITMKNTIPSQSKQWKSPTKKKTSKNQDQFKQSILDKTLQKSLPKIPQHLSSQTTNEVQTKKSPKTLAQTKKPTKKASTAKQNYIFLDNDLIKFSNLLPLFIVKNSSQFLDISQNFSLRNEDKSLVADEKQGFMRHSKVPSCDSVDEKTKRHVNYIERSFCEEEEKEEEQQNCDNFSFLRLNIFDNMAGKEQTSISVGKGQLGQKNSSSGEKGKISINQVIELNNSVARIQKWWRVKKESLGRKKDVEQKQQNQQNQQNSQQGKKESLETIQTKQEESQRDVFPSNQHPNNQQHPQSLSQKSIPSHSPSPTDPNDILHLRQTAAHIQYSTHEQILKQLLGKGRIGREQYEQQLEVIKGNLSGELRDVEMIRGILRESAEKVEKVMEKARRDILRVKGMEMVDQKDSTEKKEDILETIFGNSEGKIAISNEEVKQKNYPPPRPTSLKAYKRIKIPTYQTQLQQFSNQKSSDQQNSFLSNQNAKIFNSPNNANSENNLNSPNSNNDNHQEENIISSSQNLQEEIFSCQIGSSPSVSAHNQSVAQPPLCMTANFQQLYKDYQLQQQTKTQLQTRISKQLGVPSLETPHQQQSKISINTSIVAIHKFLLNFFKFYLYYHKNEFLTYMNMPYGESVETRLMKNRMKDPEYKLKEWIKTIFYTQDDEEIVYGLKEVIDENVLEEFFESYYEETDIEFTQAEKMNIELEKIHNRAVFHAFNHALNFFRPYYNIGGAPYLWCSSEKSLTFFCIGEDNIQEVYEKTQMKILKTSSHLCGVIVDIPHRNVLGLEKVREKDGVVEMESPFEVMENQGNQKGLESQKTVKKVKDFDDFFNCYTENFNPAYLANLEERLKKKEFTETQEENMEWFGNTFEEGKVSTLLNLTDLIEEIILLEECSILQNIQMERNQQKSQLLDQKF